MPTSLHCLLNCQGDQAQPQEESGDTYPNSPPKSGRIVDEPHLVLAGWYDHALGDVVGAIDRCVLSIQRRSPACRPAFVDYQKARTLRARAYPYFSRRVAFYRCMLVLGDGRSGVVCAYALGEREVGVLHLGDIHCGGGERLNALVDFLVHAFAAGEGIARWGVGVRQGIAILPNCEPVLGEYAPVDGPPAGQRLPSVRIVSGGCE